jgi:hypothetical protein
MSNHPGKDQQRQPEGAANSKGGQFTRAEKTEPGFTLRPAPTDTRTEAYSLDSPAADVRAFRGKPIQQWFDSAGERAFIAPDGSYACVSEDTGHQFVDVIFNDGTSFGRHVDGGCYDDRDWAQHEAESTLRDGLIQYEEKRRRFS